jgi:hypothetical protein
MDLSGRAHSTLYTDNLIHPFRVIQLETYSGNDTRTWCILHMIPYNAARPVSQGTVAVFTICLHYMLYAICSNGLLVFTLILVLFLLFILHLILLLLGFLS